MKNTVTTIATLLLSLSVAAAGSAAGFPETGLVIEGEAAPGLRLGTSRAAALEALGAPARCVEDEVGGRLAECTWHQEAGRVTVRFEALHGGASAGAEDDVVGAVRFSGMPGWKTVAGLTTALVEAEPKTARLLYPNADVAFESGGQVRLVDSTLGIEARWTRPTVRLETPATIAIFAPQSVLAERRVRVEDVKLWTGKEVVYGAVVVVDSAGRPVEGATVAIRWEAPFEVRLGATGVTDRYGVAIFKLVTDTAGSYTLLVERVQVEGGSWDVNGSERSGTILFE
jgi:hypothetical protein